jgi:C4-dicarboxylate transporter DctM subunit
LPLVRGVGVDPVHFGIIMVVNLAIGFVTPPMGINLFVASSMTGISVVTIAKNAMPFIIAFLIALVLITFIPAISLALL